MHFYTSQLCLHSRDAYFTTKNHFYGSPRFECFTSSILLAKMFISICKLTPTVLLALTVSRFLFSSLGLFHYYRSAHFDCFTATVHLALNKTNDTESARLQRLDDHSCTLLNAQCTPPASPSSLTYARECALISHFRLQLCTNHSGMHD